MYRSWRCTYEPLEARHAKELCALWGDEQVVRYLECGLLETPEQCQRWIERLLGSAQCPNAFVARDASGGLVGLVAGPVADPAWRCASLMYEVCRARWGHGYGHELACAMLRELFIRQRMQTVGAVVVCENQASIRILQRVGMTRSLVLPGLFTRTVPPLDAYQYQIDAERYFR